MDARIRAAAASLHADTVAREVVGALSSRGVDCLLLRGPAFARIRDGRTYGDVDLLVAPAGAADAERALVAHGFAPATTPSDFPIHGEPHAHEWRRTSDRASVDLHRTVAGAGAVDEVVWRVLSGESETVAVSGAELRCPNAAAVALLVALHASHHGPGIGKPLIDLRAALEALPPGAWRRASRLAEEIAAGPAFAAGLRLDERGAEIARDLDLPDAAPATVRLRAVGAPPTAWSLLGLLEAPGARAKADWLLHGLVPSPAVLRHWRPVARRSRAGLAVAYATHPFWLLRHAGPSAAAVRRARKEAT